MRWRKVVDVLRFLWNDGPFFDGEELKPVSKV